MTTPDSVEALEASAKMGEIPPEGLNGPLKALWLTKADQWDAAHDVAQDLGSKLGDWIHALLHLIEGDLGNSAYWYARAGQTQPSVNEIDAEWVRIAEAAFKEA